MQLEVIFINELLIDDNIKIENMIYEIRGKQVMLDSDLAKLYQCTNGTKDINKAVSRNLNRFPEDFYFQITNVEFENLKFQNGTSKSSHGGVRKLPYVFTEQGVAMLSSVLKTKIAAKMSINIMRAFVAMRKYISADLLEQKYINNMVLKHDDEIKKLKDTFSSFKVSNNEIYFDGQIYDAYSKIIDIMKSAKNIIVLIDAYADKMILDIISKVKVKVILITKSKNNLKQIDIDKYKKQYHNLEIIYNDTFHDRYFILDNCIVYHCGTSLNFAGTKTFSINRLEDKEVIDLFINKVNLL